MLGAAAIILTRDIGFEYPDKAGVLVAGLKEDAARTLPALLDLLGTVAAINARLDAVHALQGQELPAGPCAFSSAPHGGVRCRMVPAWSSCSSFLCGRNRGEGPPETGAKVPWQGRERCLTWGLLQGKRTWKLDEGRVDPGSGSRRET